MSKLFICNTTKQKFHHSFRIPEMNKRYFVQIPPGSQVEVVGGIGPDGHKAIVAQLEIYGGRDAKSVNGKLEDFPGLFYRFDKPVPVDDILTGHAAVLDHADKRSAEALTNSAIANDAIQRDKQGNRLASQTEVEVIQEVEKGARPTGKEIKSKITVFPTANNTVKY
jgi:hypothetical protein